MISDVNPTRKDVYNFIYLEKQFGYQELEQTKFERKGIS